MTIVVTANGALQGRRRGATTLFAGIPYAAAPTGPDRFGPPRPVDPWTGVRDATAFGPPAPQLPGMLGGLLGPGATDADEDCLTCNVTTPGTTGRRPVMVWIHGGAFTAGTGATSWYDGKAFAEHGDVVVVTANYRLGALGFLHLGALDPDLADAGVAGLLDQLALLQWVRDHIEHFGGDPQQVTVFGESAGAMGIACLLAMPGSAGLIHRAVLQSGAGHLVHCADDAGVLAERYLHHLGARNVGDVRRAAVGELLRAQQALIDELRTKASPLAGDPHTRVGGQATPTEAARTATMLSGLAFLPVHGTPSLPQPPVAALGAGAAGEVELIVGTNQDEWNLYALMADQDLSAPAAQARLDRSIGGGADLYDAYAAARPGARPLDVLSAVMTDAVFRIPALRIAEARPQAAAPTRVYRFAWPTPAFDGRLGACHALEIPFVWHNLHKGGAELFLGADAPTRLADAMHTAWWHFAHTGSPEHAGLPAWPGYDTEARPTLCFTATSSLEHDPDGHERALWDGVL